MTTYFQCICISLEMSSSRIVIATVVLAENILTSLPLVCQYVFLDLAILSGPGYKFYPSSEYYHYCEPPQRGSVPTTLQTY